MGLLTVAMVVVLMGVFHVGTASAAENESRVGAAANQAGSGDGSGYCIHASYRGGPRGSLDGVVGDADGRGVGT